MDDDKTGLSALIAHRHLRPSYARMISWEFSRSEDKENESGPRRRKSKKDERKERKVSEVDDENNDDSDLTHNIKDQSKSSILSSEDSGSDSEYVTADEDSLTNSLSYESDEDENTDSVFECSFSTCLTSSSKETNADVKPVDGASVTIRKRAPSKKQKKKRRNLVKKSYFLEDLPFAGSQFEDVDNDFNQKMHIQKNVPSLIELCIRAMRRQSSRNQVSKTVTPYGIKSQLSSSHAKFSLVKYQLSWFYRLLSHFESKDVFSNYCMYKANYDKLKLPVRNVWNSRQNVTRWRYERDTELYRGHYRSCYLAFTHIVDKEFDHSTTNLDNPVSQVMSVLASTIDLMLSSATHQPKKKVKTGQFCDEDELLTSLTRTSVSQVKAVMLKRFPQTTKPLFDRVLPYVFWARGDIKNTVQSFQECVAMETSVRRKALYTSEIGRVYAMFDEPQKASSFFMNAAEILLGKNNYQKPEITKQVEHQTRLLKASVYDQGFMTTSKAMLSASAWNACVNSEQKPLDFEHFDHFFAVDAFLCFHSGSWKNETRTWLEEAKDMLTMLGPKHPELFFFLSMVHALEGNANESKRVYRGFTCRVRGAGSGSPGQDVKACSPNSTVPWEELAELVCEHGTPIPLPVLWRIRFTPPRFHIKTEEYSTDIYNPDYNKLDKMEVKPRDADVSSRELNLRMTDNGYITGDLQLLLPPIRGIYMNPYTGTLTFPQIPGDTENWKSAHLLTALNDANIKKNCASFIPVITDIYHDSTGVKVQLLSPSLRLVTSTPKTDPILHLIWSGPRAGQKAKINLVTKLRDFLYKDLQTSISKQNLSENDPKRILELLKMSYNKGWRLMPMNNKNPIWKHVDSENRKVKKLEKQQKKTSEAKSKSKFVDVPFNLVFKEKPFVFGKTIFLSLDMDGTDIFVFVNCSTKEEFMHPVITNGKSEMKLPETECNQLNWKNAEVFYVQLNSCIFIYDRYGDDFDRVDLSLLQDLHKDRHRPVVIKSSFYAISKDQSLYCTCNTNQRWAEYLGLLKGLDSVGELLVVITEDGYIRFVENTCLMPVGIEKEAISSYSIPLEDNALHFQEEKFQYFKVIGAKPFEDSSKTQFLRAAIAVDNHLIIVRTNPRIWKTGRDFEEADTVKVTSNVALSGQPREICFISEIVGYFVTVTQHVNTKWNYRENIYHFDHQGKLLGILPCLGPGPRSFLPLYLTGDPDLEPENKEMIKTGWHIYMRDGHDGIMCVRL